MEEVAAVLGIFWLCLIAYLVVEYGMNEDESNQKDVEDES